LFGQGSAPATNRRSQAFVTQEFAPVWVGQ
jgi:hypothetical protein